MTTLMNLNHTTPIHYCQTHAAVQGVRCRCPGPHPLVEDQDCTHSELSEDSLFVQDSRVVRRSSRCVHPEALPGHPQHNAAAVDECPVCSSRRRDVLIKELLLDWLDGMIALNWEFSGSISRDNDKAISDARFRGRRLGINVEEELIARTEQPM